MDDQSRDLLKQVMDLPGFTDAIGQLIEEESKPIMQSLRESARDGHTVASAYQEGRLSLLDEIPVMLSRNSKPQRNRNA